MDTLPTLELSPVHEQKPTLEIFRATEADIDSLARIQWLARKNGVEKGYLPDSSLNLHIGEDKTTLTEERGIAYAKGEVQRFFRSIPGVIPIMLGARENGKLVGKAAIDVENELKRATFHSLEVLPKFQGGKIASKLRNNSIETLKKDYPDIQTIRLGRYIISSQFAQEKFGPDSFFNALREKSRITEDTDNGVPFEWLTMPIEVYEQEVKRRAV